METFLTWLLISSKDPERSSLTIKATLVAVVPFLTIALGFANIQVGDLTPVVDTLINFIQTTLAFIASGVALYGFGRKVLLTLKGEHAGLNAM